MRTLRIEKPGRIVIGQAEKPRPGPGELLVRVNYVGFCGSDLKTFLGRNPLVQYPRIPGHEVSGVIMEAGREVPDGFPEGEPVTVVPYTGCGSCPACRRNRSNACSFNQTLGIQRDGAMQEYMVVPWSKVVMAPGLKELELALVEPLTVGFHAVERGRISPSDTVAVLGCGMVGAGAVAGAAGRGARVIAVDVDDHKLELAGELGAEQTFNSRSGDLVQALARLTGGDGPDVVIEAAGHPATYRSLPEVAAYAGRVVCIGYTDQEVPYATRLFVQKEIDLLGSRNATPEDFRTVIDFLKAVAIPLDRIISAKVRPEEAAAALRKWADEPAGVMKLLLDLTDE